MDPKYFLSQDPKILATAVKQAVNSDRTASYKRKMRKGVDYYQYKHDILHFRLFYMDNEGKVHEETSRSNIKIPHGYLTELIDQKVQYLLSNPVEIKTEQKGLQELLDQYIDEDFQLMLQELVEGGSQKGYEFVYTNLGEDRLSFQVADSLKVIEIYDADYNLIAIIRYYDTDIYQDGKTVRVTRSELWDSEKVWYFISEGGYLQNFKLDPKVEVNPLYHDTRLNPETKEAYGRSIGNALGVADFIPFLRYDNNKYQTTDLDPIKPLIDDYDLMACALSNNLQDFDQPFFAVKGFNGDSYEQLINNLRSRGAVGVGDNGGLDVHTVNIPVEARKAKLTVDKEGIYKFGMGFDSSQVGDGNVTNVVIQSRYTLLDLKCNKAEIRLRKIIKQMLELIVADINQRNNTAYDTSDLEIIITRDTMIDETEVEEREKTKAERKQIEIDNILNAAVRLDDETVLKYICEVFDLDYEEVQKLLDEQDYEEEVIPVVEVPEGDRIITQ